MSHQAPSLRRYLSVFAALMVLTATTVWAAYQDFGRLSDVVALAIATLKATLVVLYFMHVKDSTKLTKITVVGSIGFFLLLMAFVFADIWTRGMFETPFRALVTP